MTDSIHARRAKVLADLASDARTLFGERPELNSVMMLVAKYWADGADDEVHLTHRASTRRIPMWPIHEVQSDYEAIEIPGEEYASGISEPSWDELTELFAPFCHDFGSQEENESQNALPWAIARRAGDDVEVELVGRLHASEAEDDPDADEVEAATTFDDPRARELLDEVARELHSDEPRRVLADYLQERGDPRGELIALALSPDRDARARHDELLAAHRRAWIAPLHVAVPIATMQFARGFLARCEIERPDNLDMTSDAVAWRTVEEIRFSQGRGLLPCMTALRRVTNLSIEGLAELADPPIAWPIESLEVRFEQGAAKLLAAANLPKLARLALWSADDASMEPLAKAAWWPQLTELVVTRDVPVFALRSTHRLARAAIRVSGWELAATDRDDALEVSRASFDADATFANLIKAIVAQKAARVRLVRSACWDPDDAIRQLIVDLGLPESIALEVAC